MRMSSVRHALGPIVYAAGGVSVLSILGQLTVVATIPLLTRLYSPSDFGVFTIYLSIVNILAAIAAMRLDGSLYVVEQRAQEHAALKLVVVSIAVTSLLTASMTALVSTSAPEELRDLTYLVPIGMAATGLVEILNCWCLRRGQLRDFAIGRFISPASMALSQVSFGLLQFGADSMVLAHVLSQLVPIVFLSARLFTWKEICEIILVPWTNVLHTAKREYKFPLFDMPATVLCFAIINLPSILIGALFGTSMAGHFGVASRLFSSPISLVAVPLSNVFVADATRSRRNDRRYKNAVQLVLLAGAIITLPALLIGLAAPYFVTRLLGADWTLTGHLMTALALMGAAQALSTPVQEVPTLLRRQGLRLWVDVVRTILVFFPIGLGVYRGWDPLFIIYWMSAGGAVGYLIRTAICLHLLKRAVSPADMALPQPIHPVRVIPAETEKVI